MQNPERRAAMSGYLVIARGVAAAAFERGAPSANAPIAESVAFYSKYRSELLAQSLLFVLNAGAYLWFFGSLRAWLERAEAGAGRISSVSFGAGTVSVVRQMLLQTLQIAAVTGGASGSDAEGAVLFARVGWARSVVAYVQERLLEKAGQRRSVEDSYIAATGATTWVDDCYGKITHDHAGSLAGAG